MVFYAVKKPRRVLKPSGSLNLLGTRLWNGRVPVHFPARPTLGHEPNEKKVLLLFYIWLKASLSSHLRKRRKPIGLASQNVLWSVSCKKLPRGKGLNGPTRYTFWQKRYPIPNTSHWLTGHIPSYTSCIPFKCCKLTVFLIWINDQTRIFLCLFHSLKKGLLAF